MFSNIFFKISEKTNDPFLKKMSNWQTDRQRDRQTDRQTDIQKDTQKNGDFIGPSVGRGPKMWDH